MLTLLLAFVMYQGRRLKLKLDREKQNPTCLSKKSQLFGEGYQLHIYFLLLWFLKKYLLIKWQRWTFFHKHNHYNRDLRSLHSCEKVAFLKSRITLQQTNYQPGSVIISFAKMSQWVQLNRIKTILMYKDRNCTWGTSSFQLAFSHKLFTYSYKLLFKVAVLADFEYRCSFSWCFSFIPAETHLAG